MLKVISWEHAMSDATCGQTRKLLIGSHFHKYCLTKAKIAL